MEPDWISRELTPAAKHLSLSLSLPALAAHGSLLNQRGTWIPGLEKFSLARIRAPIAFVTSRDMELVAPIRFSLLGPPALATVVGPREAGRFAVVGIWQPHGRSAAEA